MVRKVSVLIPMFFLCLGLDNCKSPEGPEKSKLYRYNVEVIYSDVAEGENNWILLYYGLWGTWGSFDSGYFHMTKIGDKKARCYLPKVMIIDESDTRKHWVSVQDFNKQPLRKRAENIYVEGAYDLEISTSQYSSELRFKMSNE